jgi:hypothetical protein
MQDKIAEAPIQPYDTTQLAKLYKIDPRTFNKWIKPFEAEIGERTSQIFTIRQVEVIFDKVGRP